MGKITGFLEIDRNDRDYAPVADRVQHWREFVLPLPEQALRDQAARCMDCGIPYCHTGCPVNNQIPDWNDLVYQRRLGRSRAQPALDQQFPRSAPAASARRRARPPARSTSTTTRSPSRRSNARSSTAPSQKAGSSRNRLRTRPARRSPSSAPARPASPARSSSRAPATTCMSIEKTRQARRPAALRHPRLQDGEGHHRPPRQADGSRRRDLPLRRPCRRRHAGRRAARATTTRWCWPAAPRSRATCRSPGRELDGIHFAMDFLPQQNRRVSGEPLGDVEPILGRRASTSSSSAAATPAPTASAPRSARARCR